MQYTSNFNLKKPDGTDVVNVQDFNDNADILDTELKKVKDAEIKYGTASGTNTYTVTLSGITSLTEGLSVKVKFTNANTGASTLNINGLGAKAIQKAGGTALSSGNIKAGQVCHLVYTGSVFQLLGEGGEYGNVTADKVLQGVTFGTESGLATGTMPNQGAISYSLPINGTYTIPAGYHNGSGKVTQSIPTKAAATITPGTTDQTIAAGQYLSGTQTIASLGGNATQADVLTGRTFSSNAVGRAVAGTMPNNGAWNGTITLSNSTSGSVTIPTGYHSGGGKVTATVSDANLVASNIRKGKSILGVTGTLVERDYSVGDNIPVSNVGLTDVALMYTVTLSETTQQARACCDNSGNVYTMSSARDKVYKYNSSGQLVWISEVVDGTGCGLFTFDDNFIYCGKYGSSTSTVYRIDPSTGIVQTFDSYGDAIYVLDGYLYSARNNGSIRKVRISDNTEIFTSYNSTAKQAYALAVNSSGEIFLAVETDNNTTRGICKFNSDGIKNETVFILERPDWPQTVYLTLTPKGIALGQNDEFYAFTDFTPSYNSSNYQSQINYNLFCGTQSSLSLIYKRMLDKGINSVSPKVISWIDNSGNLCNGSYYFYDSKNAFSLGYGGASSNKCNICAINSWALNTVYVYRVYRKLI